MHKVIFFSFFCFLINLGFAQTEDIIISVEKVPKGFDFYATNTSDVQYEVKISMKIKNLRGYDGPFTTLVPAGSKILVKQLFFVPNKTGTYSYNSTFNRLPNSEEQINYDNAILEHVLKDYETIDKGIVVFSKDGCPRCHYTTSYLSENNIDFRFIDVIMGTDEHKLMWSLIQKLKPTSKTIVMPVVLIDGKISYSIDDLKKFVETLN